MTTKRTNNLIKISIAIFAVTAVCKVYLCTSMAVKSAELKELYDHKISLEKDISRLSFEDAELSSISRVEEEAAKLGFVEMTENLLAINPNTSDKVALLTQ